MVSTRGSILLVDDEEKILKALDAKAAGKAPRYGPARFPDIAWPETLQVPPPWEGGDGKAVNDQRRPVLDTREHVGASASASGGGAPREIKK